MPSRGRVRLVESAAGGRLSLVGPEGSSDTVLDGMSSWWAAIHGYRHPVLDQAISFQLGRFSHVMFGGLTNEPAVVLSESLVSMSPDGLEHVFLADSGSVAVEVAMKLAIQYWRSVRPKEAAKKTRMMTWRGGYHGDTLGAMSVCDPESGMHSLWTDVVSEQVFLPPPPPGFSEPVDPAYASLLREAVRDQADRVAAVIVEPVVQGAGGMRFHNPAYLRVLREATEQHGVLLILDEIATGFGRTGRMFAAEHAGIAPDIMCVGKALTGGYMSLAATLCSTQVAHGVSNGEVPILAHGPTFMGNALACSAANASLGLLLSSDWGAAVERIQGGLQQGLAAARARSGVADVRVLGAIGVVQLDHPVDVGAATEAALARGVWLRPFGDLVYTMPPYVVTDQEVSQIAEAVVAAAAAG
ncbi:MAG: adenosylmethionine--8-amino-7-oxononanoate transaminase [Actinomycetota bacterium]|nr:adenosylmethionine--8-amino-7-oxononanoate transaminase [Actinomycetota bacterium]